MTELDHERLDVYQVSLDFAAWSYQLAKQLKAMDRHSRDQLLRASQSVTLNIAEGCGKLPSTERRRLLQIAGGSARECAAILDILSRSQVISGAEWKTGKELLARIVAMLTRMMDPSDRVRETERVYGYAYEYVYGGTTERPPNKPVEPTPKDGAAHRLRSAACHLPAMGDAAFHRLSVALVSWLLSAQERRLPHRHRRLLARAGSPNPRGSTPRRSPEKGDRRLRCTAALAPARISNSARVAVGGARGGVGEPKRAARDGGAVF
jgi:four helix bundle protein